MWRVKRSKPSSSALALAQSSQLSGESWQYVLLLPPLLRQGRTGVGRGKMARGAARSGAAWCQTWLQCSQGSRLHAATLPCYSPASSAAASIPSPAPAHLWPYSSPMYSMGTPCATSSAASMLRIWRCRRLFTAGDSVGPSAPQFQLRLWLSPSLQAEGGRGPTSRVGALSSS